MKNELCHDDLCSRWLSAHNMAVTEKLRQQPLHLAACFSLFTCLYHWERPRRWSGFVCASPPATDHPLGIIFKKSCFDFLNLPATV